MTSKDAITEIRELREWNERKEKHEKLVNDFIDDISEIYFKHWRYVEDYIQVYCSSPSPFFVADQIREKIRERLREGLR